MTKKILLKQECKSVRASLWRVPRWDSGPRKETGRTAGPTSTRGRSRSGQEKGFGPETRRRSSKGRKISGKVRKWRWGNGEQSSEREKRIRRFGWGKLSDNLFSDKSVKFISVKSIGQYFYDKKSFWQFSFGQITRTTFFSDKLDFWAKYFRTNILHGRKWTKWYYFLQFSPVLLNFTLWNKPSLNSLDS